MFDNESEKDHIYHSSDCSVAGQGVDVTFKKPITIVDFIIHTRENHRDRYKNICLYADGEKIACTPSSDYTPGAVIKFMDFRIGEATPITATLFTLKWEGPGNVGNCAQIKELFIDYTGTYYSFQLFPELNVYWIA